MNKRFQDSFTSRVQLEYAFGFFSLMGWRPISPPALIYKPSPAQIRLRLLLAGGLAPNISASVDLQVRLESASLLLAGGLAPNKIA